MDPFLHASLELANAARKGDGFVEFKMKTGFGPPPPVPLAFVGATYRRPLDLSMQMFAKRQEDDAGEYAGFSFDEALAPSFSDLVGSVKLVYETWKTTVVASMSEPVTAYEVVVRASTAEISECRDLIWDWLFDGAAVEAVMHLEQLEMFRTVEPQSVDRRAIMLVANRLAVESDEVVRSFCDGIDSAIGGTRNETISILIRRMLAIADKDGIASIDEYVDGAFRYIADIRRDLCTVTEMRVTEIEEMSRRELVARLRMADVHALRGLVGRMALAGTFDLPNSEKLVSKVAMERAIVRAAFRAAPEDE